MKSRKLSGKVWFALIVAAALVLIVLLAPFPRKINVKLTGVFYEPQNPDSVQSGKVVINGWAKYYLLRQDTLKGDVYFQEDEGQAIGSPKSRCELTKKGDSLILEWENLTDAYPGFNLDYFQTVFCLDRDLSEAVILQPLAENSTEYRVFAAPAATYEEAKEITENTIESIYLNTDDLWDEFYG